MKVFEPTRRVVCGLCKDAVLAEAGLQAHMSSAHNWAISARGETAPPRAVAGGGSPKAKRCGLCKFMAPDELSFNEHMTSVHSWGAETATERAAAALPVEVRAELRSRALRSFLINGAIAAAGALVSFVRYNSVAHAGGTYLVWWGAIAFGGYRASKAWATYQTLK